MGEKTKKRKRLGDRLIDRGFLTAAQLEVALKEQKRTKEPLGSILTSLGFVREEDLALILFEDVGVDFVSIKNSPPDRGLLAKFDLEFMQKQLFLPLRDTEDGIDIAMVNPSDIYATDAIQHELDRNIIVYGITRSELLDALAKESHLRRQERGDDVDQEEDEVAVDAVDAIIRRAVELGATDLHIEPEEKLIRVRYRVDGILVPGDNLPIEMTRPLVTRLKILSSLDITENRLPQDGRMRWTGPYGQVDIRISILPCVQGETVVCRLLDHSGSILRVERLGIPAHMAEQLQELVQSPNGLFYVTGPTGSGKTTSLYALLATLDPMERKICTVEDPVEYRLPLIRQCQVHSEIGLTFAAALRSLLRQDPDVMLIGETRDLETAQMAVRASLTGHFVLSTLHTTTALGAISRLQDMGIERFLISASLCGVMGQRLVRQLCKDCAEPKLVPPEVLVQMSDCGIQIPGMMFVARGCAKCSSRGYHGRVGVYEYLAIDDEFRDALNNGASMRDLEHIAVASGFHGMRHQALELVAAGETSIAEIARVIPTALADESTQREGVLQR